MSLTRNALGRYCDLIFYKAYADLKAEASRTYVNFLWWIFDPLLSLCIYYLVFAVLFQRGGPGFIFVLLTGLIFWRWYSESIAHAASTISNGKGLMTQVEMPKWVFPVVCLFTDSVKFSCTLVILLVTLLAWGPDVQWTWLALPLLLIVQLLLITGLAMIAAALVPFLPDLKHVISTVLMAQMFLSGVFYSADSLPSQYQALFFLNPMARLLNEYREILLYGHWPHWAGLAYVGLVGAVLLGLGLGLIRHFDKTYPRLN